MGKQYTITIDSIMGGIAPYTGYADDSQFNGSIGIDPDLPNLTTSGTRPTAMLSPSAYTKFSGANLTGYPRKIITNPKNTNVYVVESDGKFLSYDSTFANETVLNATVTITIASPGVFTATAHGLIAGSPLKFITSGALPTGITAGTTYYVIAAGLTANEFEVSATVGGAAINTSGSQSGTHRIVCGNGEGAEYYNNYIYIAAGTDILRYGPLDGTPAINHSFWRGTLSLTALDNTISYPTGRGVQIPSHSMHVHADGFLYICDFDGSSTTDTNRGKGLIHRLGTKYGTSGTAHQGAVNDSSAYNVLDLSYDFLPMDIESYGIDIAVLASQNTDSTIVQGRAALFLWNVGSNDDSFYNQSPIFDPVASALLNHNGNLIVWSGNMNNGVRVSRYAGGQSFEQIAFFEDGFVPTAGAVESFGNRIVWGGFTKYPENSVSVFAKGYKHSVQESAINNIINTTATATSTTGMVTALKYAQHASFISPRLTVGWIGDDSTYGIDNLSSTFGVSVWRAKCYYVGNNFQIKKITIPLGAEIGANMIITPKIFTDNEINSNTLDVINNTNFSGKTLVHLYPNDLTGKNNFVLELRWTGTANLPVKLPISITIEEFEEVGA